MLKILKAYFPAVLVTYVVAVVFGTLTVLYSLADLGLPVTSHVVFNALWHDLIGMIGSYLPLLGLSLGVCWLTVFAGGRWTQANQGVFLVLAGFSAVILVHLLIESVVGVVAMAPARTVVGLLLQGLAGALGGVVLRLLSR
jgi:hypothetical protein